MRDSIQVDGEFTNNSAKYSFECPCGETHTFDRPLNKLVLNLDGRYHDRVYCEDLGKIVEVYIPAPAEAMRPQ